MYISLILLVVTYRASFSQLYNYKHYTVADGFPQSNANDIFQDQDGYIWFATQNGAARFDGFEYFLVDKYKGLKSNFVKDINQDKSGNFWFSTNDGLTKYADDTCCNYTTEEGLSSNLIKNTFELPDGRILILTNKGTDVYDNDEIENLNLKDIPLKFIERHNGEIWCVSETNIYKFENDSLIQSKFDIPDLRLYMITEDKDSALWLASNNGIYRIKDEISHFTINDGLADNDIRIVMPDSKNNLWYASERKGCGKFAEGKFYNLTSENGMTNTAVLTLFEDNENNIWIGGRNGATMINPRIPFIQYKNLSFSKNRIIMGITEDKNGHLWFCSYGEGIFEYDGILFKKYNKENGAFDNHFFDVETDVEGNLWIATANSGILLYDGKKFKQIKNIENALIESRVLTIFKDSKNNLWFGTNGEGVIKYNGKSLSRLKQSPKNVLAVSEDNDHNIWFGTLNEGLFRYDGKKIERIDKANSVIPGEIRAIVNIDGNLWFGTASEGIYTLKKNHKGYSQVFYNKSKGLNSDNIYLLFVDSKKNLWCGTEKGVDKIKFDEKGNVKSIKNYTVNEGFLGVETDLNGAYEDKSGNIWFGTVNGILKYNNSTDEKNLVEAKTYLTGLRLNFKDFDWSSYCDSVDKNGLPVNLVLPYNKNHLTFDFIGLCYSNPKNVEYTYRLTGQNNEWSPPSADRRAIYSNIAPGEYTFELKSSNNNGVWNPRPVSFSFIITPPFWDKLWFKTSALMLFLIIAFVIIDYRNRYLKKAKNLLEIKVSERTAELKKQKEAIENINIKITDSINYAGKIQKAMMPSGEILDSNFSDNFILFKPRDIVSGDFYWAKEVRRGYDTYLIIVTADSTGHGIPGALVSMLGMSLLNEIVRKEGIQRANAILEELRKEIKASLKQKGGFDDRSEGIDMAVIVINKHTKEMQYAGANSPLYIIREGNMSVLEPTINPVGIFLKELPFKNELFQLQKGDVLYMFSDGYEDQFNGITGEKFMIKRFRELLISVHKESCEKQKQILEEKFYGWKGNYEQIDDVLILGLKV